LERQVRRKLKLERRANPRAVERLAGHPMVVPEQASS